MTLAEMLRTCPVSEAGAAAEIRAVRRVLEESCREYVVSFDDLEELFRHFGAEGAFRILGISPESPR